MAESKVVFLMNQTSVPAGQAEDGENYAGDPNGEATRLPISAASGQGRTPMQSLPTAGGFCSTTSRTYQQHTLIDDPAQSSLIDHYHKRIAA